MQSDLSDFVYEPGNLFQGGVDNGARYKINLTSYTIVVKYKYSPCKPEAFSQRNQFQG